MSKIRTKTFQFQTFCFFCSVWNPNMKKFGFWRCLKSERSDSGAILFIRILSVQISVTHCTLRLICFYTLLVGECIECPYEFYRSFPYFFWLVWFTFKHCLLLYNLYTWKNVWPVWGWTLSLRDQRTTSVFEFHPRPVPPLSYQNYYFSFSIIYCVTYFSIPLPLLEWRHW